jgi:hypothetical protein
MKLAVFPLGAMALACAGDGKERTTNELSPDLSKDLQLASAASVELATGAQGYERTRVVSAIEAEPAGRRPTPTAKAPKPRRANPPRPVPKRVPKQEPAAASVEESETVATAVQVADDSPAEPAVAAAPDGAEQAPADQPTDGAGNDPAPEPLPAPRPTPVPVSYPGPDRYPDGGGGDGVGTVIGTVIGVVIRGGGVGVDHCDEHEVRRRRGRGGGISIGGVGIPVMGPTFPAPYPRY